MSYNGKSVNGMTVQEVADALSLLRNPCRLKLSRYDNSTFNRRDFTRRPMSVDANANRPSNILSVWNRRNFYV